MKRAIQIGIKFVFDHNNLIFVAGFALLAAFAAGLAEIFNYDYDSDKTFVKILGGFIFFICITIISVSFDLKHVKEKVENSYTFKAFNTGEEFDDYLRHRLNTAKQVNVIHFSSTQSSPERAYVDIIDKFVDQKKGIFKRIIADSTLKVYEWSYMELIRHKDSAYSVFLLDTIKISDAMRTMGVMIIDEDEVCFGGGYQNSFKHPTISIQNRDIVRFYKDYFGYLLPFTTTTRRPNHSIKDDIFKKAGVDVEAISKMNIDQLNDLRKKKFTATSQE